MRKILLVISALSFLFYSCEDEFILDESIYDCNNVKIIDNTSLPGNTELTNLISSFENNVVGTQVYLRDRSGNEFAQGFGKADIPNNVDLKNCTKMMIGSVSKIFTAVLIMQLQEEGTLNIDDPIKNYLDDELVNNIANANAATIRHLLGHRSGIKDYLSNQIWVDALNQIPYQISPKEKLEYIYGKSADFDLDTDFNYSNSNYVLLGIIAENAKGVAFHELLENYIFTPLNLANTIQGTTENPIPEGTARPYYADQGVIYRDIYNHAVFDLATADGGIISNMVEVGIFMDALFNGQIISEASLEEMMSNPSLAYESEFQDGYYGLGFEIIENADGRAYGHGGSTASFINHVFYYPETGAFYSLSFNNDVLSEKVWEENHDVIYQEVVKMANQ